MKLLYAGDERSLSEAVVDILTYHKYIVDAVYDGEDAYAYALSGNYDGVILDVMMPGRDGIDVLSALRKMATKRQSSCSRQRRRLRTASAGWMPERTTIFPSLLTWASCWRACAPCSGGARNFIPICSHLGI